MTEHSKLSILEQEILHGIIVISGAPHRYDWPEHNDDFERIKEHIDSEHHVGRIGTPDFQEQYERHAFEFVRRYLRNHPEQGIQKLGKLI